jgi:hypothetical protein
MSRGCPRPILGRCSGSFSRRYTARIVTGRADDPIPSHADSGKPVSVTGAASSPASVSPASPSTAGVFAASVPTEIVFSIRAWQRDRSGPTEVARISSPTWSGTRKRPYQQKDITVIHTQTGSLVGKCGQNVGTAPSPNQDFPQNAEGPGRLGEMLAGKPRSNPRRFATGAGALHAAILVIAFAVNCHFAVLPAILCLLDVCSPPARQ